MNLGCTIRRLPTRQRLAASREAHRINPVNAPCLQYADGPITPQAISVLTTKYWGSQGVRLKIGFMERVSWQLADRVLSHFLAWNTLAGANVEFQIGEDNPEIRISLGRGGYWSYLGTDVLQIDKSKPTMNLEGFSMSTSEAEARRVIRHEVGHTMGFPHEHMRESLVQALNVEKTIRYFQTSQGWSAAQVRAQVLTPLSEASLMGTPIDGESIMCYQLPASITKDGKPILGGKDINSTDAAFAAKIYPKASPIQPTPPPRRRLVIEYDGTMQDVRLIQE